MFEFPARAGMWDASHFWLLDSQCKPTPNHVLLGSHFAFPCSKPALRPWDLRGAHFSIRDSPFRRHIGRGNLPYGTLLVLRIRLQMESGFGHYSNRLPVAGGGEYTGNNPGLGSANRLRPTPYHTLLYTVRTTLLRCTWPGYGYGVQYVCAVLARLKHY